MSLSRLWLFLAVALPVLASLLASMSTVDLTYQLRAGAEIIASRSIPSADSWTFTAAGQPWVDQQWGAQVVLAVVERIGSWTGLALFRALLTGIIFGALVIIAHRRGIPARTTALLVLLTFVVAAPAMALRPQLLGMASFAVVLLLVADRRAHPGRLWLVPLIVAAWANLHGSFFLGPLVLGLAWLEDLHDRAPAARRTLALGVVSALAASLTPFGPWVWAYAVGLSANPEVTARVTEWQPTSIRDVSGLLFFASLAGVAALATRRGRPMTWPTLAWLATFALIGLYAQRGIAWWPIAAFVAVAGPLIPTRETPDRTESPLMRRLNVVVAGALILAGVALVPIWRPLDPGTRAPIGVLTDAPSGITAALRDVAQPGDRVFNPQVWGSWFEYAVPGATYTVDSRIEVFPAEVWRQYEAIAAGAAAWETRMAAWDPRVVIIEADAVASVARFEALGYARSYEDADGLLLVRP